MEKFKNENALIGRIKRLVKDYKASEYQIRSYLELAEFDLALVRAEIARLAIKGKKNFGISFKHMAQRIDVKEVTLNSWIQKQRLNNDKIVHVENVISASGEKKNRKAIAKIKEIIKEHPKTTKKEALVLYNQEKAKTKEDLQFEEIFSTTLEIYDFVKSINMKRLPRQKVGAFKSVLEKILQELTNNIILNPGAENEQTIQ